MPKLIYKKQQNNISNSEEVQNISFEQLSNTILNVIFKKEGTTDYSALYNELYKLHDIDSLKKLIETLSIKITEKIKINLNEFYSLKEIQEDKLKTLFEFINNTDIKLADLRQIIMTNSFRFNSDTISEYDKKININIIINDLQKNNDNLVLLIKEFLMSIKDNKNKLLKYLKIFEKTCNSQVYKELITLLKNDIINTYINQVKEIKINTTENLIHYFNSYNKKIDDDISFYNLLFGEQISNLLKEQLIDITYMDKLSNEIFKNESFLEQMIKEETLNSLKFIEKLSRRKNNSLKQFQEIFFDFYYKYFMNNVNYPKTNLIKDGLAYINDLLVYIRQILKIYNQVFKYNRQVHYKFNEILVNMSNPKNIKNFKFLLAVFIHENLYKNPSIIFSDEFKIILKNLNEKDIFFQQIIKFTLKRISNFAFKIDIEQKLDEYFRNIFEYKYIKKLNKIIIDIKSNLYLSQSNVYDFYLLTNDALIPSELQQVLDMNYQKINFEYSINQYKSEYPHRKITISQILSTSQIQFKDITINANYIQSVLLILFNGLKNEKYQITYEKLISSINCNKQYISLLRNCINTLIQCKILIKINNNNDDLLNSDILQPNFDLQINNKYINCFEKTINNLYKELYLKNEKSNNLNENNDQIDVNKYLKNKKFIIECKLIKMLKSNINHTMSENDLIKGLLKDDTIKSFFQDNPNILYFKNILEELVERSFIGVDKKDGMVIYSYFQN